MNFTGKHVLVTGGSRGIGRAIARAFAECGARVAINYNTNRRAAEETMASLPGGPHFIVQADIAQPDPVRNMIDTVVNHFGRLDIVINNAGIFEPHPINEVNYNQWQEAWQRTLSVNLLGPANVCYCAAQVMIKQGGGRIVNISSRGAFRGEPEAPAYGAAKAGLNAMSQSLAQKLARYNIFVGVVAPGFVETDRITKILQGSRGEEIRNQSPLGRIARPEEIAQAALFLAAPGTEFTTGTIIDVNGASYLRT